MRWILCLVLLFGSALPMGASPSRHHSRNPIELTRQIDSILAPFSNASDPGLAVLVKSKGSVLFERAYGSLDLRTHAKCTAATNFRLASFTKQFTAMAIMLLVHDGKLHYDDHLTELFPEFPPYGRDITVRHLLTHTSGLPDYEDLMEAEEKAHRRTLWSSEHQIQDAEVLQLLERASAPKFSPGSRWAYSNSAYVLLGLIVAKVSGVPYRDFLEERIFTPAGMKHSMVYQSGINTVPNRAFGHSRANGKWLETDQSSTSATLGDGGIYSNLEDLSKWDEALQQHTLLGEQEMALALTPVKLNHGSEPHWPLEVGDDPLAPGKPVSYGFGWFLDPYEGHARMWHSGTTVGFRTVIERFPGDQLTIVILSNRADLDTQSLSDQIAGMVLRAAHGR